jgi:hypothetical protein
MSRGIILSLCDYTGTWSRPFISLGYTVVRVDPMHDAGKATTEGTTLAGSLRASRMDDGGFALAATAGQLADILARSVIDAASNVADLIGLVPLRTPFDAGRAPRIVGVLAAPPCTHFAGSGARWWAEKDARGDTDEAVQIVRDCLRVVALTKPDFWALENPAGRLERLVPELQEVPSKVTFHPCDYAVLADDVQAEAYTKRTVLWGKFDAAYLAGLSENTHVEPVMIEKRRKDGTVVRGSWMWANLGGKSERTKALRSKTPTGFARAFALSTQPDGAREVAA